MIKNLLIALFAISVLTSCTSETEKLGISEVSKFYGCAVSYKLGSSASSSEGSKTYFELELSGEALNALSPQRIGRNAARVFYEVITVEERAGYTHINVIVNQTVDGSNSSIELEFPTEELELVFKKERSFFKCADFVSEQNFEEFFEKCAPLINSSFNQDTVSNYMLTLNDKYGEVTDQYIKDYEFYSTSYEGEDLELISFSGIQVRDSVNYSFIISVSRDEYDNLIYAFNF